MKNTTTLSLLILVVLLGAVAAGKVCNYKVSPGTYISGWAPGYAEVKFKTFKEAQKQCDSSDSCTGITQGYTDAQPSQYQAYPYAFFTLRGTVPVVQTSPTIRETSYLKGDCNPSDFVVYYGTYLSGCANNCKDYATLEQAQQACRSTTGCGGVSFSKKYLGGSGSTDPIQGKFGFQLRSGNAPYDSPYAEDSWVKINSQSLFAEKQSHVSKSLKSKRQ